MRIGASLVLIAVGAVLTFAVTKRVNGIDLDTVGVILMIVGAVGLVISLILTTSRRRTDVIYGSRGTTVIEPNDPIDRI
jgi:tellurite resistance protein TehA-like permease